MDAISSFFAGNHPASKVWLPLVPGILAAVYFLGGLAVFAVRSAFIGVARDKETIDRGATVLVGFYLRHCFFWLTRPFFALILRTGISANAITTLSALLGVSSGLAVGAGRFALGGWLFLGSGILDVFDGRIARARGETTKAGAAIDSVLDRYTDTAMLMGLGWYYRESWVLVPVLFAILGSSMVPYIRARGEGLGISIRGGAMQRLERVLYLGASVTLTPIVDALVFPNDPNPVHWLAIAGVSFLAITSNWTAITRFRALVGALNGPSANEARPLSSLLGLHVLASLVATGLDFAVVVLLVERGMLSLPAATLVGSACGAVVNFTLNRVVTFPSAATGRMQTQAGRYALVSVTSAFLNAGGVALCSLHPGLDGLASWWVVRGVVHLAWNFPLHRTYVFERPAPPAEELEAGRAS